MLRDRATRSLRVLSILAMFAGGGNATAQLTIQSTFNPENAVDLCGIGVDSATGDVWVYGCFLGDIQQYSSAGAFLGAMTRPGETANDVDVEVASEGFTLNATPVPAGTLLFINGESGVADIYGMDTTTENVVATLNSSFGASHVVGGAYHPARQTLFLVQDNVPVAADRNRIAEVDPETGLVVSTFQTGAFAVSYGDVEVCPTSGNLLVVSSIQTSLAEFTPAGVLVGTYPWPAGVTTVSGIALNDVTREACVASTNGNVWRLSGVPCRPCSPPLVLDEVAGDTQITWPFMATGIPVDVVKGHLPTLRTTSGDFTAALDAVTPAPAVCLGDDVVGGMVVDAGADPAAKAAWFYVGRCQGETYDGSTPGQVGSRDAEIDVAVGSCP